MEEYRTDVLVRTPNWIGDAILSFPALKAIAKKVERTTVISHSRTAPLFSRSGLAHEVFSFRSTHELFRISISMRSRHFALGIVFPFSFSSAAFMALTGVRTRIGYSTGPRRVFFTHPLRLPRNYRERHLVETYFQLARAVDPDAQYSHPLLPVESSCTPGVAVGIAPGATFGPAKRWGIQRYVELVKRIVGLYGCEVHIFGGPDEHPLEFELDRSVRVMVKDFTGKTDILKTASLIAQCKLMICNDTGIMHLAAAVGTPVIALFGSTNPSWTGPLGPAHSVLRKPVPCAPCYQRTCPYGTNECLRAISVEEVVDCVNRYLSHPPR
ncbi:MAG: hypothetical protein AMJ46_06385 [Latescibacteria bacterium DG_63]|nr:MAG: hypothetical protein AMJ46_06385 [Latescibacteria bacterium DG_63]